MMLRMLLVLVAVLGLSLSGCKKEEPKPMEPMMDQMKQDAEKAVEEAAPAAEEAAKDAQEAAGEAAEAVQN